MEARHRIESKVIGAPSPILSAHMAASHLSLWCRTLLPAKERNSWISMPNASLVKPATYKTRKVEGDVAFGFGTVTHFFNDLLDRVAEGHAGGL